MRFRRNPIAVIGLALVAIISLSAVFARFVFALHLPILPNYLLQHPAHADLGFFTSGHLVGTDALGRDDPAGLRVDLLAPR
jgi:ABC-type dipeptide/oligopeptide/nickel transport system permease subunit